MERLTNEAIKVDASVDGMIGSFVDLANMKPKLLDVILNGPTLISVSKNVLRSIIRQLYSALAAYEDTGLTPEQCAEYGKADREGRYIVLRDAEQEGVKRLRELAKADKDGRLVVLPRKVGDTVYCLKKVYDCSANRPTWRVEAKRISGIPDDYLLIDGSIQLPLERFNKTVFLTREEAEAALEAMKK